MVLDIIKHLEWLDIALLVDDDVFSQDLMEEFLRLAGAADICIMSIIKLPMDKGGDKVVAERIADVQEKGRL